MNCPSCHHENPDTAKFCNECGTRFTPPQTTLPQGERRQLTVMFVDLVGSTALSEHLDPEDFGEVIAAYQATCRASVESWGGFAARTFGDGLLVYFGYPKALEDAAYRAIRAGREILGEVPRLTERFRERLPYLAEQPLAVRVGIHTGLVVVGDIATGGTEEHVALGEAMNVAARLQGVAEPNQLLISDATLQCVPGQFLSRDLGTPSLKGVSEPIPVHAVLQATGARNSFETDPSRATSLVGREFEVGLLLDHWKRVKEGQGQAVLLSGEPGVGKSRLLRTLRECLADEPHRWIECHASPYTRGSAFSPLIELLEHGIGCNPEDPSETKFARLEKELKAAGLSLDATMPFLTSLLSLPLPGRYPLRQRDSELQRKWLMEALAAWIFALAERQPLVMLVEDLHWCDDFTVEFLGMLLGQSAAARVLTLLTFRREFEVPWPNRAHITALEVNRLGHREAERLIASVARDQPLSEESTARIVERADGVPLFLEELAKMVLESGDLAEPAIPTTLQDSLMARLDRLSDGKNVAQHGAACGREFSYELLLAISDRPQQELEKGLSQLIDAELLYPRGVPPKARYTFKHVLIQEAAYQSLLKSARQGLHARIGEVLEERSAEGSDSAAVVAHHWEQAGEFLRAARWRDRAAGISPWSFEGLEHWQRARELLALAPRTKESLTLEAKVCSEIMISSATDGRFDIDDVLTAGSRAAQELGDRHLEACLLRDSGFLQYQAGRPAEALETWRRAEALAQAIGDEALLATLGPWLSMALGYCGPLAEAIGLWEELSRRAETADDESWPGSTPPRGLAGVTRAYLAYWYAEVDDRPRSRKCLEEARLLVEDSNPTAQAVAYMAAGHAALLIDDLNAAKELWHRYSGLGDRHGLTRLMRNVALGARIAVAEECWEEAVSLFASEESVEIPRIRLWSRPHLALAHQGMGNQREAMTVAREMSEETRAAGARVMEIPALLILSHILRGEGTFCADAEATTCVRRAARLINTTGALYYRHRFAPSLGLVV